SAMARAIASVLPVPLQYTIATLFISIRILSVVQNGSSNRNGQPGDRRSAAVTAQIHFRTFSEAGEAGFGLYGVAVHLPIPFAGIVLALVHHKADHILQRITEEDADL